MKPKTLFVLVAILAVLGGLVYMRQSSRVELSIVEEAAMKTLAPPDVAPDRIDKLVLYTGERAEKKVTLVKTDKGWRTASFHDAPASADKVDPYIEDVASVQGEFRATAPDAGLTDYGLAEDNAFHIEGYEGEARRFHVLVGKSPKYKTVFMRAAESNDVYVTDARLKEDAGLFGNTEGMAASPDWWLDKQALDMDKEAVTAIDLTYPDKHIRFELREVAKEEPAATESAEGETETPAPPPEPEFEWVVAEGGLDKTLKTAAVDAILRKLDSLNATTIVDPEKKAEYNLDPPNFVAKITMRDGSETVVNGGRPGALKGTYLTRADDEEGVVYSVSRFDFEDLFPFGSDLYDFKAPDIDSESITRIELKTPEFAAVVAKEDGEWRVVEPKLSLDADAYKPGDMAKSVSNLTVKDYAVAASHLGLDDPVSTAVLHTANGDTVTIARGIASGSLDGHYVTLPGIAGPVVVENTKLDRLFVELADLFDLTIFSGVKDGAIVRVELSRGDESFVLEDKESVWSVTAGDETFNADADTVEDYLFGLTVLEADDFSTETDREPGEIMATLTLATKDGAEFALNVEEDMGLEHAVTASNHPELVFTVKLDAMERILRGAEHFRPKPADEQAAGEFPIPAPFEFGSRD